MQRALEALEQYKGVVVTHYDPESFRRMEVDGGQAARDAIAALRAALLMDVTPAQMAHADAVERKPLSEDEIVRLMVGEDRAKLLSAGEFAEGAVRELVESGRAIERAHGIGEQDGS